MMVHLVRRAIGSFSNAKPEMLSEISRFLLPAELNLWLTMAGRDQRHSIDVLKRFLVLCPDASRAQGAAALLHDVGKGLTDPAVWPRHIAHEHKGVPLVKTVSQRCKVPKDCQELAVLVCQLRLASWQLTKAKVGAPLFQCWKR